MKSDGISIISSNSVVFCVFDSKIIYENAHGYLFHFLLSSLEALVESKYLTLHPSQTSPISSHLNYLHFSYPPLFASLYSHGLRIPSPTWAKAQVCHSLPSAER